MEYFLATFALVFIFLKISSGMKRQRQVLNIVYANYTFQQLDDDEKNAVIAVVLDILRRGRISNAEQRLENFDDLQRYGFYALAMAELGIHPAIGKYDWAHVSNPIIVSGKVKKELNAAIELFYQDHGIKLNLK